VLTVLTLVALSTIVRVVPDARYPGRPLGRHHPGGQNGGEAVVDDGSRDDTPDIVRQYAKTFHRIWR
jgi:hypothetical protein